MGKLTEKIMNYHIHLANGGITQKFIISIVLIIIVYDLWAYYFLPSGNTVSEVMTRWAHEHPMWALFFGGLMVHWFGKEL
jgi:hypothetical protein